jgi:hypothetical protein
MKDRENKGLKVFRNIGYRLEQIGDVVKGSPDVSSGKGELLENCDLSEREA